MKQAGFVNAVSTRAATGLMLGATVIALVATNIQGSYLPLQIVTLFATLDFALRLIPGRRSLSPLCALGSRLKRHKAPALVRLDRMRLTWTISLLLTGGISLLLNNDDYRSLTATLLIIWLTVLWMEANLGIREGTRLRALRRLFGREGKSTRITIQNIHGNEFQP